MVDELLDGLDAGRPRALSVVGTPGIGKTRLLAELTSRSDARGHLVLTGSGSELERDMPFGPFVDALDRYVESLEPHRLARLGDDVRGELARLLPSLSAGVAAGAGALPDERYRSHRAVRALLETLAARPLLLVLDDFHWADGASIELAGALLRRPPAARVMLVLAARPRLRFPAFTSALARAARTSITRAAGGRRSKAPASSIEAPSAQWKSSRTRSRGLVASVSSRVRTARWLR